VVVACINCQGIFAENSDIEVRNIYENMAEIRIIQNIFLGLNYQSSMRFNYCKVSIFYACKKFFSQLVGKPNSYCQLLSTAHGLGFKSKGETFNGII
jgi:hypothetical protein